MEPRWLMRRMITLRPLLPSTTFLPSVSTFAIRPFSNSTRLPAIPPLPTTGAPTIDTPPTSPPVSRPSPDRSMADIFKIVAKSTPAPQRRDFESIYSMESNNPNAPPLGARVAPRTGPSAGRSITVKVDLPGALSRLRGILTSNNVKADQVRQRFHERPGLKKKRLKSARHRKRFKAGFKKLVSIAMDMKRKGL